MPIHDWTRVDAGVFHDFHFSWIGSIRHTLNDGLLPSGYYAMAEQVTGPGNPDVLALRYPEGDAGNGPQSSPPDPSTSRGPLITTAPRVRYHDRAEEEIYAAKARGIVIRRSNGDRVVAVIEIVSPGNKGSRHAIRSFVSKAVEYLNAGVQLLVIDLWPPTPRDPQGIHPAIWSEIVDRSFELPPDKPLTLASYSVGVVKEAWVELVAVGDTLPDMPLYLTPNGHVDVSLELTYQTAWAEVPHRWKQILEPSTHS
jgi:hypothetical protein